MKTTWIVGGLLLLALLLLTVRERFELVPSSNSACPAGAVAFKVGPIEVCGSPEQASGSMPTCPDGSRPGQGPFCTKEDGTRVDPVCESGSVLKPVGNIPVCVPSSGSDTASAQVATDPVPGSTGVGAMSGTTTGGTSGMTFGPTTQSTMVGKTVWGPASKGLGEPTELSPSGGDSSKSTPYPVLLGGESGKSSTRIEGVGVVPPSGLGLGGVMPSSTALGTDANSMFLPYSRQPGDQDIVPDPYRLAKTFSTSSYSSKTDPVPFLTDFSAFYK